MKCNITITTVLALLFLTCANAQTPTHGKEPKASRLHLAVIYSADGNWSDSLLLRYDTGGKLADIVKRSTYNVEFLGIEDTDSQTIKFRRFADPEKTIELNSWTYTFNSDKTLSTFEGNHEPPGETPREDRVVVKDSIAYYYESGKLSYYAWFTFNRRGLSSKMTTSYSWTGHNITRQSDWRPALDKQNPILTTYSYGRKNNYFNKIAQFLSLQILSRTSGIDYALCALYSRNNLETISSNGSVSRINYRLNEEGQLEAIYINGIKRTTFTYELY